MHVLRRDCSKHILSWFPLDQWTPLVNETAIKCLGVEAGHKLETRLQSVSSRRGGFQLTCWLMKVKKRSKTDIKAKVSIISIPRRESLHGWNVYNWKRIFKKIAAVRPQCQGRQWAIKYVQETLNLVGISNARVGATGAGLRDACLYVTHASDLRHASRLLGSVLNFEYASESYVTEIWSPAPNSIRLNYPRRLPPSSDDR